MTSSKAQATHLARSSDDRRIHRCVRAILPLIDLLVVCVNRLLCRWGQSACPPHRGGGRSGLQRHPHAQSLPVSDYFKLTRQKSPQPILTPWARSRRVWGQVGLKPAGIPNVITGVIPLQLSCYARLCWQQHTLSNARRPLCW